MTTSQQNGKRNAVYGRSFIYLKLEASENAVSLSRSKSSLTLTPDLALSLGVHLYILYNWWRRRQFCCCFLSRNIFLALAPYKVSVLLHDMRFNFFFIT